MAREEREIPWGNRSWGDRQHWDEVKATSPNLSKTVWQGVTDRHDVNPDPRADVPTLVATMRTEGKSTKDIAADVGVSPATVRRWETGKSTPSWERLTHLQRVADHTPEVQPMIAALRADGTSVKDLAADLGVSKSTIYRWQKGQGTPTNEHLANLQKSTNELMTTEAGRTKMADAARRSNQGQPAVLTITGEGGLGGLGGSAYVYDRTWRPPVTVSSEDQEAMWQAFTSGHYLSGRESDEERAAIMAQPADPDQAVMGWLNDWTADNYNPEFGFTRIDSWEVEW